MLFHVIFVGGLINNINELNNKNTSKSIIERIVFKSFEWLIDASNFTHGNACLGKHISRK